MKSSYKKFINYTLDILLLLPALACLASGYVIWFIIPRGMGAHGQLYCQECGRGPTGNIEYLFGLSRYSWIDIHNWVSVALFLIIALHIFLHWNWIVETTKKIIHHLQRHKIKVLELYGAAITLLILFVFNLVSGLVIWLVLPRGMQDYEHMINSTGRTFLFLQRNVWVDLHGWISVMIVAIIIIHLIINWSWVLDVSRQIFSRKTKPGRQSS